MKQKDVAIIIVIAFVSAVISFVVSSKVFTASYGQQKVETVDKISASFNDNQDSKYFNTNSIDPTQLIHIGTSTNPNPFSNQ